MGLLPLSIQVFAQYLVGTDFLGLLICECNNLLNRHAVKLICRQLARLVHRKTRGWSPLLLFWWHLLRSAHFLLERALRKVLGSFIKGIEIDWFLLNASWLVKIRLWHLHIFIGLYRLHRGILIVVQTYVGRLCVQWCKNRLWIFDIVRRFSYCRIKL